MTMNRRDFLKVSALAGGGLLMGVSFAGCSGAQRRIQQNFEATGAFRPNMYLTIRRDDKILVDVEKSEMGQGIWTSHAMLVAEELGVDMDQIETSSADAARKYQTSFGLQQTGGSTSAAESFLPVRKAAATAREMLIAAAAAEWKVDARECSVEKGVVHHQPSDRTLRYGELAEAAVYVEIPDDPPLKDIEDFEVIGTASRRIDAREKVDGSAVFGIDVEVPDKVCALCIHPPIMGAEANSVDAEKARQMTGIIDVVSLPCGVAVVAEKYWQARRAAPSVNIEWSEPPLAELSSEQVRKVAATTARKEGRKQLDDGDVGIIDDRDNLTVVEAEYASPYLAHAPMEPQNCTVHVRENAVEVWAPTQSPTVVQEAIARFTGMARGDVTVHVTLLGGGFGRRLVPDFTVEAAMISDAVGRPVQLIWSREDDTRCGYYRPINHNALRGAVDDDGNAVAWRYHNVSQTILPDVAPTLAAIFPEWFPMAARRIKSETMHGLVHSGSLPEILAMEGAKPPYKIDNLRLEYTPIRTPMPVCLWRAVGHSFNGFVVESFVDELAHAAGADPYLFRRQMLDDEPELLEVLDRAAEAADWGEPLPDGVGRGIAVHESFDTPVAQVIEASLENGEIRMHRIVCVVNCGIALNPDIVRAQMEGGIIFGLSAALRQEITFTDGRVEQGNFDDYPMMTMIDTPPIEVHIIDSTDEPTGVGEPGLPPAAPALANAIYDASGVRLRDMPFEKNLAKLRSRD